MNAIYQGSVYHSRLEPVEHTFDYPVFFFAVDLDRREETRLLHINRRGLLSLRDADHLDDSPESLAAKCRRYMGSGIERITMLTVPRIAGYVFNPVTFYLGYGPGSTIVSALAEVNNTFNERHVYALHDPHTDASGKVHFTTVKAFHVSPFNDRLGEYQFRIHDHGGQLAVHVDLVRDGRTVFKSGLVGQTSHPLTDATILRCLLRYPWQNLLTKPRIHVQAARLYFGKKLRYYPKPAPQSTMTIQHAPPTALEKIGQRVFNRLLHRLKRGKLTFTLPDGSVSRYGSQGPGRDAAIHVTDYTFFRRVMLDGDIGLGEAYMFGQWDSPDLTGFLSYIIENRDALGNGEFWTTRLKWLVNRLGHLTRANTRQNSQRNIGAHYDLSNEFFALFLDPTMMYSSAIFETPGDTLEEAQHKRMKELIGKLQIDATHHVLEIGSGWGGFAIEMARETGCRVTSITISQEQHKLARERVAAAGLADLVSIEFCDYRDVQGAYDRIVSIEMLEAVGHEHYDAYFGAINRVLKPGGRVVLQVITMPHDRYEAYRKSVDWIQKYIFPGGLVPSIEALRSSMQRVSSLAIRSMDDIGLHYATTLRHWSENLAARRDDLRAMGYDDVFYRTWQYYFSYCEAGFLTRALGDHQIIIERS